MSSVMPSFEHAAVEPALHALAGERDATPPDGQDAATRAEARAGQTAGDLAACRALIRHGSHTFFAASRLLPRRTAIPATALYAFCRVADDLIDGAAGADTTATGPSGGERPRRALAETDAVAEATAAAVETLRARLDAIYAGRPEATAEDRAFAEVVVRYRIPRSLPEALLEGLAWDAAGREYPTLSSLYDYAARVAGCVGAMMTLVMETSDARAVARACDLGVAMQLTNIARDVGEDAAMGRIYLPREWFDDVGLDAEAWLADPVDDPRVAAMTRRLLGYADILYRRAEAGIALLPLACRPGIRAARLIYAEIGHEVARAGYANVRRRAVVGRRRKAALLARALATVPLAHPDRYEDRLERPPLSETRYLLEDIESVPYRPRVDWLIELCATLRERETLRPSARAAASRTGGTARSSGSGSSRP